MPSPDIKGYHGMFVGNEYALRHLDTVTLFHILFFQICSSGWDKFHLYSAMVLLYILCLSCDEKAIKPHRSDQTHVHMHLTLVL